MPTEVQGIAPDRQDGDITAADDLLPSTPAPKEGPADIKYMAAIGDSLSSGKMPRNQMICGCFPFDYWSGLRGVSPAGRFTNGFVWTDLLITIIAHDFTINRAVKAWHWDKTDLSDAIIVQEEPLRTALHQAFSLDSDRSVSYRPPEGRQWRLDNADISDAILANDERILKAINQHFVEKEDGKRVLEAINKRFVVNKDSIVAYPDPSRQSKKGRGQGHDEMSHDEGKMWVRRYCEGGLMAHNYHHSFTLNPGRLFARKALKTLGDMRQRLLKYDEQHHIDYQQKAETLVIEWSGANDLITLNSQPNHQIADKAIEARVKNVKKLIASGYQHFILFNLPDLSLTPRFQRARPEKRERALEVSLYFNQELQKACDQLNQDYPHCSISIFDICTTFQYIYNHPEKFLFDAEKRTIPYIQSDDFISPSGGVSPAQGYMFYDDVHPSADMHALLASLFYSKLAKEYRLLEPDRTIEHHKKDPTESELVDSFKKHYKNRLARERSRLFHATDPVRFDCERASLTDILRCGLRREAKLVRCVLQELGWFNKEGQDILSYSAFRNAMSAVTKELRVNDGDDEVRETSLSMSLSA